ncbi:MAG: M1 family metallopeptidase [Bacteroidetes bacterium]|nr:M1 family metallopeptidase [Bacteroidota bacterium]
MKRNIWAFLIAALPLGLFAQSNTNTNKFKQLGTELPTSNTYRTASGAPGHQYWQQQADYKMSIKLDDEKQTVTGTETITYTNNSPDVLTYLWLQLDQNVRAQGSDKDLINTGSISDKMSFGELERMLNNFDGGFKIQSVTDVSGNALKHTIVKTMMRVDLASPLKPGAKVSFKVAWWYNINNRMEIGGRSGYEYFEEEDNYLYTIAQFFPRMCVYSDNQGWQHKQFLGRGEFTLPFGDYEVEISVPDDHIVAATGELQNASKVLTAAQRNRFAKAKSANDPVMIVTQDEAEKAEKNHSKNYKTWVFKAKNVRDFAFATSRKFIWDAQGVSIGNKTIMAMSFYPKEGNPLWEQYSTKLVAHTIKTYSKYTIDYQYPVAISVHANAIGMEYPMICFNGGRPEKDGTYSQGTKYGMHGVIIHEVGHNFFPMIINSDERQWTWMDEGLNTFVQFLTEQEWDKNYPSRRGPAHKIVDYMGGDKSNIMPIMTNSESIIQFGNNAYAKPCTALNILRETVLGRELFDYAFKEYCTRWAYKHPTPADFFRTMEDASGVDLDWFWRGWFYTTDHCDQGIAQVDWFQINTQNPEVEKPIAQEKSENENKGITYNRNNSESWKSRVDEDKALLDFYLTHDKFRVYEVDKKDYERYLSNLTDKEKALLESGYQFYQIKFINEGGLVMPVIVEFEYVDGTTEQMHIPAEIWRFNDKEVTKVFVLKKEVVRIELDPNLEVADTDRNNNYWPPRVEPTRFQLYKNNQRQEENPMQRMQRNEKLEKGE